MNYIILPDGSVQSIKDFENSGESNRDLNSKIEKIVHHNETIISKSHKKEKKLQDKNEQQDKRDISPVDDVHVKNKSKRIVESNSEYFVKHKFKKNNSSILKKATKKVKGNNKYKKKSSTNNINIETRVYKNEQKYLVCPVCKCDFPEYALLVHIEKSHSTYSNYSINNLKIKDCDVACPFCGEIINRCEWLEHYYKSHYFGL